LISAGGNNLSGGQKQRISICRAIYSKADIYLFDDIFSSLDIHVADAIFEKLMKNMLLKSGKTILFITSHYKYLKLS
jgi:ABC-type transport system involved in cytochrome bd biosynthesis fused ATPase/permease subunit